MSFLIRNKTSGPAVDVEIKDLGITVKVGVDFDLTNENPAKIANSTDLQAAITSNDIVVIDPLDGTTELSLADSVATKNVANDPHWRLGAGSRINDLSDVDVTGASIGDVLRLGGTGSWDDTDPSTLAANQDIWETISADTGSTTANTTTDTLTIAGAGVISTSIAGDTLTISDSGQDLFETITPDSGGSVVADSPTDILTLTGGTGITTVGTPASDTITITNTAPNVDQNIWETIVADSGSTVASTTFDTLTVAGGAGISTAIAGDTITITNTASSAFTYGTITGDTGTATAASSNDTLNFTGIGITTAAAEGAPDTVTFTLDIADLSAGVGPLVLADEVGVNDSGTTLRFTFTDVVEDLDIPNAITANGLVTRTAADTYASRTITASANEDELGITITNGDGVAGNPTVGLDIDGTTSSPANLASTDEFLVHDKSEGTGGANRSMTGLQIADGANTLAGPNLWETISSDSGSTVANTRTDTLTIAGGAGISTAIAGDTVTITNTASAIITISTIDGQPVPTFSDTTRGPKTLSVETVPFVWSENRISNNDWLRIGTTDDAAIGHVMPHNCTIIKVTAKTTNNNGNTKNLDLYVDDLLDTSSIVTFSGGAGEDEDIDVALNIDITAGEKLQLRGDFSGGTVEDTTVTLFVKWRA